MLRPFRRTCRVAGCAAQFVLVLGGCGGGGGSGGSPEPPTVTLTASETTVNEAASVQLTWSSTNASSCTASGGWSGSRASSGSASSGPVYVTTDFVLSCTGSGGTAQATERVTVRSTPQIQMSLSPDIVRTGATSTLDWSVEHATTCTASGGWSGDRAVTGSEAVGPLSQDTQYVLECSGDGGSGGSAVLLRFREGVNVPPQADAGPDQTVIATSTVHLNAFNSVDDNSGAEVLWAQTGGPAVELSNPRDHVATFVAPHVNVETKLTFLLTVTDDEGASDTDTVDVIVQPIPDMVTISGLINYTNIRHGDFGTGLYYPGQGLTTMRAEVLVEAVDVETQSVLAGGRFAGSYELSVPSQREIAIRVTAEMSRQDPLPLPHWHFVVRDLDVDGHPVGPVHAYTTPPFDSGPGGTNDVQIPSGWSDFGQPTGPRDAAPFAILETIFQGIEAIIDVDPTAAFPELTIDWSPGNAGGQAYYTSNPDGSNRRIVLSGERNVDTDEYDPHVILHEFGHYLEDAFSRSDSLGGPHGFGDVLDMRVAFSEGLATVLGAIALGDDVYRDSFGFNQGDESFFNIDFDEQVAEGWYSEWSASEILWDLYDSESDGGEQVSLGLAPIWQVLTGPQRETHALTSIFTFATALREARPADAPAIANLLSTEQIEGPTIDAFGVSETNDAGSVDVLPVYTPISLGQTVRVRSTNEFGTLNKLSNDRFLLLSLATPTNVRFIVSAATGRDADISVFRNGVYVGPATLGPANEDFTLSLDAGDYVLDVYDCGNADCNDDVSPAPTDITVTISAN